MSADIYGGITVDLNDGPVRAEFDRGYDGREQARLVIGDPNQSIAITVTQASPEAVADLAEVAARLLAWTQRQTLKEVA